MRLKQPSVNTCGHSDSTADHSDLEVMFAVSETVGAFRVLWRLFDVNLAFF